MCSRAISNLGRLYKLKPDYIKKEYYDYTKIGLEKLSEISNTNLVVNSCAKSLKIEDKVLIELIEKDYKNQLEHVIKGISSVETKLDSIILLS